MIPASIARAVVPTIVALALSPASAAAANFGQPGPVAFSTTVAPTGFLPGVSDVQVVAPTAAGSYPLVIATHGFAASSAQQLGWAKHFASYGYVVLVPTMPNAFAPDAAVWSAHIKTLAASATNLQLFSQVASKVDATKIVYEGFSAGGLASTLAAKDRAPSLLILLDPVDKVASPTNPLVTGPFDLGKGAMPSVCSPVFHLFTQPSSCNNSRAWEAFANTGAGPLVRFALKNSTHCDGEDEARGLCGSACGGAAKTANRDNIRKYMVAYLEWKLRGSAEAAALFAPSVLSADGALEQSQVLDRVGCGGGTIAVDAGAPDAGHTAPGDAGTGAPDAALTDGGSPGGGPSGSDAGPTGDSGPAAESAGAGGCACSTTPRPRSSMLGFLLAITPFIRRRRQG